MKTNVFNIQEEFYYKCSDGTKFADYPNAFRHEIDILVADFEPNELVLLDENSNEIKNYYLDDVSFIICKSERAAKLVKLLGDEECLATPFDPGCYQIGPGIYYYSNSTIGWIEYNDDKIDFDNKWGKTLNIWNNR